MQALAQLRAFGALVNESLDCLHFIHGAGFESARVMEDEFAITLEDHLILDVVHSTLLVALRW